jgi:molecular chaperone DnaK
VLAGEVKDLLLLDVTPLSLGIETLGGVMTTLIPRNTTIPTRKSEVFSTAADNQTSVEVHVLQGERPLARGQPHARPVPFDRPSAGAARIPQVEGDLRHRRERHRQCAGEGLGTGKEQKITITASSGLSKDEVDKMMREPSRTRMKTRSGAKRSRRATGRTRRVYAAERMLKDAGDKLSSSDIARLSSRRSRNQEGHAGTTWRRSTPRWRPEQSAACRAGTLQRRKAGGPARRRSGRRRTPAERENKGT